MRKLLYGLIGLGALVVIAIGIASLFREQLLLYALTPPEEFDAEQAPPAPDYGARSSWAALPDREDRADLVPRGSSARDRQAEAAADVFFVHPTTYYSRDGWNASIEDEKTNAVTDWGTMGGQASAFNGCCQVFAPRYRQATLASFFLPEPNGHKALDLAYEDVARAFSYYMKHFNRGRPFILASHSQGTVHAAKLLEQVVDRAPSRSRLVAAYLIGGRFPVDKFERTLKHIGPCEKADDLGCVVGWDTYVEGGTPQTPRSEAGHWYPSGYEPVAEKRWLCTNPLSWTREEAPGKPEQHLGAVPMIDPDDSPGPLALFTIDLSKLSERAPRAPIVGHSEARCLDGALYIPEPREKVFNRIVLEGGSYHMYDYSLFYMNIRKNAQDRVAAYLRASGLKTLSAR